MGNTTQNILLLNFDNTLYHQSLLNDLPHKFIDFSQSHIPQGYCEYHKLEQVDNEIKKNPSPPFLTYIGNGNYHYISFLMLKNITQPFSLVLFDHHTDMMPEEESLMSCGSWVTHARATLPNLSKVLIIGACQSTIPKDLDQNVMIITEEEIDRNGVYSLFDRMNSFLGNSDVYISVDKDVLLEYESSTNWDNGYMTLLQLVFFLREIKKNNHIVGADVCGELPLSPLEFMLPRNKPKTNDIANRAIADILLNT